jgi:hypothetical protein
MSIGALPERVVPAPPSGRAPPASPATGAAAPSSPSSQKPGDATFAAVLRGLGQEVQRGESLMHTALGAGRSGRELPAADLIALQAGVYRYGEVVDLASRLVDRATSSVKTVLEGQ